MERVGLEKRNLLYLQEERTKIMVKRYKHGDTCGCEYWCEWEEDKDGEMVSFEDYQTLEAEVKKKDKKIEAMRRALEKMARDRVDEYINEACKE